MENTKGRNTKKASKNEKKKLFVVSDIHSFFNEFKTAIDAAGFDPTNKSHLLIVCGDVFDRGNQSQEILDYLNSVKNKVLITGNHEYLMRDLMNKNFPEYHDYHNHTIHSLLQLAGVSIDPYEIDTTAEFYGYISSMKDKFDDFFKKFVPFFETKNYIFVHSWIPFDENELKYDSNWRNASPREWYKATWENPFKLAQRDLNQSGKTIVFGHWHTSWYHCNITNTSPEWNDDFLGLEADFSIADYKEKKVIGLDACTAYSGKVNVLVIEDELE